MSNSLTRRREPLSFMLYLGILGSVILFAFIIFVFVRKELGQNEIPIKIPLSFWFSSIAILLSSFTLMKAKEYLSIEKFPEFRWMIAASYFLGLLFLLLQLLGWSTLLASGITLANSTGGSFTYILSGLHIFHTLGGVIALTFLVHEALRKTSYVDSYVFSVNPPNQLKIKLISIYWHFLDILWLLIFLFLLYHATQN
ncbi:cytochrome c oxidase subunit 3 [Spirosomataceae bacterium TFI 002]|nr:cytochrome c oxidase subunit 3 [Spirosomataceae bacterium TFI 002]